MAAPTTKAPFTETELKEFLSTRQFLIVSSQPTSAKALRKLAMQVGSKVDRTLNCFTYEEAEKELASRPTHILFTDLLFDKRSGLELIELQEKQFSNRLDVASMVMCGDPSPTETAMMAEANVDAVMLKPFTFENFRSALYQALANKVKPSPYWKAIEEGKELFHRNELETAIPLFESSKKLDPKPSLAFYYRGQIHRKKSEFQDAIKSFETGLTFEPKDFRCLSAIFDTRMQCSEYSLAYDAAAKLHADYPVSVGRILDLVKLSVYGKKYEDIMDYFQIFRKVEKRDPALSRVVIAGMLVCAKYMVLASKKDKGLEVLLNAAKIANETGTLNVEVFRYFIENGYPAEGEKYFGELSEEMRKQSDAQILYLELVHLTRDAAAVVQQGTQILQQGIKSPRVYELMIEGSKKIGRSAQTIDGLLQEAQALYPDRFKS